MPIDYESAEMPETKFLAKAMYALRDAGWPHYHTHDSRGSQAGFPDLVVWRPRHMETAAIDRIIASAGLMVVWPLFFEFKREPIKESIRAVDGTLMFRKRRSVVTKAQHEALLGLNGGLTIPSDLQYLSGLGQCPVYEQNKQILLWHHQARLRMNMPEENGFVIRG